MKSRKETLLHLQNLDSIKQALARKSFYHYRFYINPKLKDGWWLREICAELQQFYNDLVAGKRPVLLIHTPPQHGKSWAMIDFFSWVAGKNPDLLTIFTSFSDRLGIRANLRIQRYLDLPRYQAVFPATKIKTLGAKGAESYSRNRTFLEFVGKEGSFRNTTVGGMINGESLDCIVAGTLIQTNFGEIPIESFDMLSSSCKILSLKTETGEFSYESFSNFTRRSSTGIFRITTESGRILECTGNHRIFTQKTGYATADSLSAGDILVYVLSKKIYQTSIRCSEMVSFWRKAELLFKQMFSKREKNTTQKKVYRLQHTSSIRKENREILPSLSSNTSCSFARREISLSKSYMSYVWKWVCFCLQKKRGEICGILQQRMCKQGTFKANGGERKSNVETWCDTSSSATTFCKGFQACKIGSFKKGWKCLRCLPKKQYKIGSSSFRQLPDEQRIFKSCNFMLQAPCLFTQNDPDRWLASGEMVVKVEKISDEAVTYDITVEKNHNFFANNILVHNCGGVDDPIKGREEANSETIRNKTWDWFTDDFYSRFSDDAGFLYTSTRWHVDDPAARLKELMPQARILTYSAIAEKDEKHRRAGEALFPELKSKEFLMLRKSLLTEASWQSLYQGHPIIAGGGMIKIGNIKIVYLPSADIIERVRYWDKAGTDDGGAYTAGVLVGRTKDNLFYIEDVVRGQWSALERERRIKQTAIMDGHKTEVWVEQEPGSGGKESAESTVRNLAGFTIKVEKVTGDKVTRAEPYAAQVEAGNVILVKNDWNKQFLGEHESFPHGKYKDQVDAAAGAFNKLAVLLHVGFSAGQKRDNMRMEKGTSAPSMEAEVW